MCPEAVRRVKLTHQSTTRTENPQRTRRVRWWNQLTFIRRPHRQTEGSSVSMLLLTKDFSSIFQENAFLSTFQHWCWFADQEMSGLVRWCNHDSWKLLFVWKDIFSQPLPSGFCQHSACLVGNEGQPLQYGRRTFYFSIVIITTTQRILPHSYNTGLVTKATIMAEIDLLHKLVNETWALVQPDVW